MISGLVDEEESGDERDAVTGGGYLHLAAIGDVELVGLGLRSPPKSDVQANHIDQKIAFSGMQQERAVRYKVCKFWSPVTQK